MRSIYTSESVGEGHPDKLADQISDAILDRALEIDPEARVAVETLVTHGIAVIAGELTMEGYVDMAGTVPETISSVGYTDTDLGMDGRTCGVLVCVQEQSPDIAMGVDRGGAGDQGMMFGFATVETPEMMPLPIAIAHAISRQAATVRKAHPSHGLRPDFKSQVSVAYEGGVPRRIETIVASCQHSPNLAHKAVSDTVHGLIIEPVLAQYKQYVDGPITYHINPTGQFVVGGPAADTGLTGRKIIVDTYGGFCPHGGGAFSGKDPTKVDRSAAYMARYVAKNVVAAGLAKRCQVAFAYAIGVVQPVSVAVDTFGTETIDPEAIVTRIRDVFDLSPRGIIAHLDLKHTKYLPTARNGHFGHNSFPWERTDKLDELKGA